MEPCDKDGKIYVQMTWDTGQCRAFGSEYLMLCSCIKLDVKEMTVNRYSKDRIYR